MSYKIKSFFRITELNRNTIGKMHRKPSCDNMGKPSYKTMIYFPHSMQVYI